MATDANLILQSSVTKTASFNGTGVDLKVGTPRRGLVARVLYSDDRSQAVDLVLLQSDVRTSAGSPAAVALTVVARAAIQISHRPADAELARRLAGALMSSPATAGLAIRTNEVPAVRTPVVAHVAYSYTALAETAAGVEGASR